MLSRNNLGMATRTGENIGTVNMGLFGYCILQLVSSAQVVSQVKKDLDSSHPSPSLHNIPSSQTPVVIVLALKVMIGLALTCLGWMEEYDSAGKLPTAVSSWPDLQQTSSWLSSRVFPGVLLSLEKLQLPMKRSKV